MLHVWFEDKGLQKDIIRKVLGRSAGRVTLRDARSLPRIDWYSYDLHDLTGLEHFESLQRLFLETRREWRNDPDIRGYIADLTPCPPSPLCAPWDCAETGLRTWGLYPR